MEKVRVTDEQTCRPGAPEPVLISFPPVTLEEVSSLLKTNLYMSKPFISCYSASLSYSIFYQALPSAADMLWYLSAWTTRKSEIQAASTGSSQFGSTLES